jgi:membrane protein required for beta-lactamase induction
MSLYGYIILLKIFLQILMHNTPSQHVNILLVAHHIGANTTHLDKEKKTHLDMPHSRV